MTTKPKTKYEILGFKNKTEFNTFNSKARKDWKATHKQTIIYDEIVNLPDDELELLKDDLEIALLAKQVKDLQKELTDKVEEKVLQIKANKIAKAVINKIEPAKEMKSEKDW